MAYKKDGNQLFPQSDCDRTRGDIFKWENRQFRLDFRRRFFTQRVVRHWHSLPRVGVDAPSLKVLKARLDGAPRKLSWWLAINPWQEVRSGWVAFKVSSSPGHSMVLILIITFLLAMAESVCQRPHTKPGMLKFQSYDRHKNNPFLCKSSNKGLGDRFKRKRGGGGGRGKHSSQQLRFHRSEPREAGGFWLCCI